ncbi:sigma factor [Sphingomonas sp. I4]
MVQEAWIRLSQNAAATDIVEPVGYIRRIVRNLALDEYRQRQRRETVLACEVGDDPDMPGPYAEGADRALMAKQELALVAAELARMPPRMRRAVELHRLIRRTPARDCGGTWRFGHHRSHIGGRRGRALPQMHPIEPTLTDKLKNARSRSSLLHEGKAAG